ncbi:hypothetical protein [Lysinibacillus fusiformis]|uniref:hypothetical protein n=1 Tax=Lysinibacillus fusiformis TaxID=28031 RepID=UPI00215ACC30|nr:hypothetical protein [Lysinibacillus fusiformis]MCR8853997.1 hypothetical protein [Lysinibacillus fusiformis]
MQITRHALSSLVKRGKLVPVKEMLFLREDVATRKEAAKELQSKYRPYDKKKGPGTHFHLSASFFTIR